ncbi:MAG: 3-deoxy-D-manno-octulosonic acid transferase, partial [Desulfobacteraceae bacterium]
MTPGYLAYKTLVSLLCLKVLPLFLLYSRISGRYYRQFGERMGYVRSSVRDVDENPVSFWVHAVSLGEVKVAASIVDALKIRFPDARFVISTFTEHGRRLAEETFGLGIPVIYAPLDVPWAVGRALDTIRPKAMVFLETELWPTWIMETKSRHIKTIIANGRISSRSVGRYRIIRPMLREVLSGIDAFSMIGDTDAERIIYLGASREKVSVNGNAKYDLLSRAVDSDSESDV